MNTVVIHPKKHLWM